jgi:hypothetical protein
MNLTETNNALIVYTVEDFQEAYKKYGNQRGVWIVWEDKGSA